MKTIFLILRNSIITLSTIILPLAVFGQIVPIADHHMHLWSLTASILTTEPLMPVVELPEDLKLLLQDKERYGGKDKNLPALIELYTKDAIVLNPSQNSIWLRGDKAINYAINNLTVYQLLPTAFETSGLLGYITGYEAITKAGVTQYLSNFQYIVRKGNDGKWRIASETFTLNGPLVPKAIMVEDLIKELDEAKVKKASVLSVAYWFGNPRRTVENEYEKVRAENDWVAEQVARYPNRLVGFCSFNPLKDYALEELDRCVKNPNFKGLKLHVGNSRIDMLNPEHVKKLQEVFRAANAKRFPVIIHLWTSVKYGRPEAEAFFNQVLPVAPDIPIQIAHMAATGPGYSSDDAFEVYATAAEKHDPRMKNVYIDVASDAVQNTRPATLELIAKRLRQFGLEHVLFGTDRVPGFNNETPKQAWESFRRLPLTEKEFKTVAENVAPYMH